MHLSLASLRDERVRLVLLLAVLATLAAYAVTSWTGAFGIAGGPAVGAGPGDCPAEGAPAVDTIARGQLRALREDVRRVVFFDPSLRPYEQGPVASSSAWSDEEPGTRRALPQGSSVPGAYEMRWWMANRDDVVADAMLFAGAEEAGDFFRRASSTGCRPASTALAASLPPGGRNLGWRNPDGFAQEDVFLLRGRRVYRVAAVTAGSGARIAAAERSRAFALVDGLACALPGATCQPLGGATLAAAGRELSRFPTTTG